MAICGIICEYDPFHLGHLHQISEIRRQLGRDTAIVCVMSGNYTQRGMPAIFDKMTRTAAALACGVDLVLELPLTGVLQSAEGFAAEGVRILTAAGADFLCFGCECGSSAALIGNAKLMLGQEYREALRAQISAGKSYAASAQAALEMLGGNGTLLQRPNDILGTEYCKAILRQESPMQPLAILRLGAYHAESPDGDFASGAAVRSAILEGKDWKTIVPPETAKLYAAAISHAFSYGERAVLARLLGLSEGDWQALPYTSEGLWSKVCRAVHCSANIEEIIVKSRSKRYPRTRLQRLLLCGYLGISAEFLKSPAPYIRALGFSACGQKLLKSMREAEKMTVLNAGQPALGAYAELETRATDLYALFAKEAEQTGAEGRYRIKKAENTAKGKNF